MRLRVEWGVTISAYIPLEVSISLCLLKRNACEEKRCKMQTSWSEMTRVSGRHFPRDRMKRKCDRDVIAGSVERQSNNTAEGKICFWWNVKERGELQRITENLVAENITGLIQAAAHCPGQMGCKVFTQLQVQKLFTPRTKQGHTFWAQHLNPGAI